MTMWKWIRNALLLLLSIGVIYGSYGLYKYSKSSKENQQLNFSMKQIAYANGSSTSSPTKDTSQVISPDNDATALENSQYTKVYNSLLDINSDAIGWIVINDTNIDYAVMQTSDNEYYLDHNVYNEKSIRGSIFMDWQSKMDSQNIVIYGHNMNDGDMLGNLDYYKSKQYYIAHPVIELNFMGEMTTWEIFSVSYSDDTPYRIYFENDLDFKSYLSKIENGSIYATEVNIENSNKILTLSTCSKEFRDARFVIHAIKRK